MVEPTHLKQTAQVKLDRGKTHVSNHQTRDVCRQQFFTTPYIDPCKIPLKQKCWGNSWKKSPKKNTHTPNALYQTFPKPWKFPTVPTQSTRPLYAKAKDLLDTTLAVAVAGATFEETKDPLERLKMARQCCKPRWFWRMDSLSLCI